MRCAILCAVLLASCGGRSGPRACDADKASRPQVSLSWHVEHGSMDADPPRARVKLTVSGAANETIEIGELEGTCRLVEVGVVPDDAPSGAKISELACTHDGRAMHAAAVVDSASKVAVRRWEKTEAGIDKLRDLETFEVPSCARFTAELAQAGDL